MINLEPTIQMLRDKRVELVRQISAIDSAIRTLSDDQIAAAAHAGGAQRETETSLQTVPSPSAVVPVRPQRVLTEAHKQALVEGRRRAREAKRLTALGLASPPSQPEKSSAFDLTPRLVKRPRLRELAVEALESSSQRTQEPLHA
jgi:hypothetical protein